MPELQARTGIAYEPRQSVAAEINPAIADCRGRRVGILIVTYNAVSTLIPVLKRIPPMVWENVEEVVVFDDASQDGTFELAMGFKAVSDIPKLHVLKHPKNLGYGGNQKAGYRYFIEKGFDVVILLHGDGQYAPEVLARMYHPIVAGEADAVFGSRMMRDVRRAAQGRHAALQVRRQPHPDASSRTALLGLESDGVSLAATAPTTCTRWRRSISRR